MLKEIKNHKGYFAGTDGYIYSNLGRGNRNRNKTTDLYKLKGRPGKNNYLRVYLRNENTGKRKDYYVHRLIAETFIPNLENKCLVNHINTNIHDNSVDNLEWSTYTENNMHTFNIGHVKRNEITGRYESNLIKPFEIV